MNQTCHMKHFCERVSFNRKNAFTPAWPSHESRYEVWDTHCSEDPSWDDPDTTEVIVFQSDDKSECEAFIAAGAQRCELRENGVCKVCDLYDRRQADLKEGKVRPFYLVSYNIHQAYGGPEEGGWYYDWTSINEVRRAHTLEEGLRQARILADEYPKARYPRSSYANRGHSENHMVLCYGESDPRWPVESTHRPRYE